MRRHAQTAQQGLFTLFCSMFPEKPACRSFAVMEWSSDPVKALCVLVLPCTRRCLPFASEPCNPASRLWLCRTMRQGSSASAAMLQHDNICTLPSKLLRLVFFIEKCITSLGSQGNQFTSCSLWVWHVMTRLLSSRKMYVFAEGSNWWLFLFPLLLHQRLIWIHTRWHPSPFLLLHWCCSLFLFPVSRTWTVKMPQPANGPNKSAPAEEPDF